MQDLAIASGAFVHPKPQIRWDQGLHAIKEEIVKLGTGLPANLDHVFKPAVVTRATRAPWRCNKVLVPTVVPCKMTMDLGWPIFSVTLRMASTMACEGSAGVEKTLSICEPGRDQSIRSQ